MPYMVKKGRGTRPYKIVQRHTGAIVASSKTRTEAEIIMRAHHIVECRSRESRESGNTRRS